MQVPKLTILVLSGQSLANLIELAKDENFALFFGWELWAEKARQDFQIPSNFFNLVRESWASEAGLAAREMSPIYRYLELAAEFEVLPEMAVSVSKGVISGVYEALAGVERCLEVDDVPSLKFFLSRLRPEFKDKLKRECESNFDDYFHLNQIQKGKIEASNYLREYLNGESLTFELDISCIKARATHTYKGESTNVSSYDEELIVHLLAKFHPERILSPPYSLIKFRALVCLASQGEFTLLRRAFSPNLQDSELREFMSDHIWEIFKIFIESGNVEVVNEILPYFSQTGITLTLEAKRIQEQVPNFPFDHTRIPSDYGTLHSGVFIPGRYHFPLCRSVPLDLDNQRSWKMFKLAIWSGNPQIFDFLAYLEGWNLYELSQNPRICEFFLDEWRSACGTHPERFVGFYSIFQRLISEVEIPRVRFSEDLAFGEKSKEALCRSVDIANLILSKAKHSSNRQDLIYLSLENSFGKINSLLFLLSKFREELEVFDDDKMLLETLVDCAEGFPLSQRILQGFIEQNYGE